MSTEGQKVPLEHCQTQWGAASPPRQTALVAPGSEALPSWPALQALHLIYFRYVATTSEGLPHPASHGDRKPNRHSSSDLCSVLPSRPCFRTSLAITSSRKPSLTCLSPILGWQPLIRFYWILYFMRDILPNCSAI